MSKRARQPELFDRELADLPPDLQWREWMGRVEAVIFASPQPVQRDVLARVVGITCNLDDLIGDIRQELRGRPYDLVAVAGGWQHRTRKGFGDAIKAATGLGAKEAKPLSQSQALILMCIAYFQPITRGDLGQFFGKEVSRETIGQLRAFDFIAAGPRSPEPGAPYTYVTTPGFLSYFGFTSLRDLPDMEKLEDAGLLSKDKLLAGDISTLLPVAPSQCRCHRAMTMSHSREDDARPIQPLRWTGIERQREMCPQHSAMLVLVDPQNAARFYVLVIEPTLFGEAALVGSRGGGSNSRRRCS